ncbi:caspase-8-like [Lingula anatina]|uniref:Caspase-8-like n=1 Tax=Lingula anatina TaxID=7574 RepID=A0A1S3KE01_LINAN|nr:caspase-8-like [Lingula anatina]|eukprot:XP_013420481.1 caspase-8-like [Lingula anatina]
MEDMTEVKVKPCSVDLFQEKAFDHKNVYKNYREWRGRAVIINNVSFDNNYHPDREGTEIDVKRLESLFQQLHYLVSRHDNMTARGISQIVERESRTDHSVYSSFIMVILSHGGENTVIGTDGYHIGYDQMLAHFEASKCPTLKGCPKMFFISACQSPCRKCPSSTWGIGVNHTL